MRSFTNTHWFAVGLRWLLLERHLFAFLCLVSGSLLATLVTQGTDNDSGLSTFVWLLAAPLLALTYHLIESARHQKSTLMLRLLCFGLGWFGSGYGFIIDAFQLQAYAWYGTWVGWIIIVLEASLPILSLTFVMFSLRAQTMWIRGVCFASTWAALESLRNLYGLQFPMLSTGYLWVESPLHALAPVGGLYLCSWAGWMLSVCLYFGLNSPGHKRPAMCFAALGLALCQALSHIVWSRPVDLTEPLTHRDSNTTKTGVAVLSILQPGYSFDQRFGDGSQQFDTQLISQLGTQLKKVPLETDVVLLGESFFLAPLPTMPTTFFQMLSDWSKGRDTALILGSDIERERTQVALYEGSATVSAGVLTNLDMRQMKRSFASNHRYDKQHMIAFSEYLPIWYARWIDPQPSWFSVGTAQPMPGQRSQNWTFRGVSLSPSICYELSHGMAMRANGQGADALINLSSTIWFAHNSPILGFWDRIASMRAMEAQRPLVIADTVQFSRYYNAQGVRGLKLARSQPDMALLTISRYEGDTLYYRWGEWVWILISLTVISLTFLVGQKNTRLKPNASTDSRISAGYTECPS